MTDYRLRPVHDARIREERTQRGELAAAVDTARATEVEVAAAEGRVAAAREAITRARAATGVTAAQLALADRHGQRRVRELATAQLDQLRTAAAHDARLGAIDAARGRLAVARAQRELIERHFARWRETQRKLAERRED